MNLTCPSCAQPLREEGPEVLRCPCAAWPIVDAIPILTPWARNRRVTLVEALARHLAPPGGLLGKLLRRLGSGRMEVNSVLRGSEATFLSLAGPLGRTADLDYFRYRFSDLSFISTAALATPLDRGPVLDLGCGAGHLIRALSRKIPPAQLVGVDLSFTLLYLARRFVAPGASFVCADASARLPFADGAFEAAVCADTFNYLPDRPAAARELLRVARGPVVLSHLDPGFCGRGAHGPLEPAAYREMFSARSPRLYRDQQLVDSFLDRRMLELSRPEESRMEALSLTAGVEPRVYREADYFVGGGALNPIYEVREEGDRLHLRRRFISERYSEVYRRYDAHLPEAITVTRSQVAERDPDLVRRFVLIDLPPRYV